MNYIADFQARSDLTAQYGNNALLLYALQLRFEISDIISVASDALTDGGNDKKCDLIYVDQDTGVASCPRIHEANPKGSESCTG